MIVGGGSLLGPLRQGLLKSPRDFVEVLPVTLGDVECAVVGLSTRAPGEQDLPFLIPALGLSFIKPEMAAFVGPDEVQDDPGGPKGATGIYDYETSDT